VAVLTARSVGSVVRDIGENVDRIARAELQLAIAGLRLRIEAIGEVSALLVAAAAAAVLALQFALLGGMFALARLMPFWLAALAIAAVPGTVAVVLLLRGRVHLTHDLRLAPREVPAVVPSGA